MQLYPDFRAFVELLNARKVDPLNSMGAQEKGHPQANSARSHRKT